MEYPECFDECFRVARKEHKCFECREPIKPKERYHYCSGVWAGEPNSYKTCMTCADLRKDIDAYLRRSGDMDGCIALGELGYFCEESAPSVWFDRWCGHKHIEQAEALAD